MKKMNRSSDMGGYPEYPQNAPVQSPKKKKPSSPKGTKARGTTQIPAITGTLMRNVHETDSPTVSFRKPTPMGTSAVSQTKDAFSLGIFSLKQFHCVLYIFTVVLKISTYIF